MEPVKIVKKIIHGEEVEVKIYPKQKSPEQPMTIGGKGPKKAGQ